MTCYSVICNKSDFFLLYTIYVWFFFSIWVFFHKHSRITGLQGKGEGISLTPHYHFHPLHRHLDISRAITAESSPLHIASSRTRAGNLWFPSPSRYPLSYAPLHSLTEQCYTWICDIYFTWNRCSLILKPKVPGSSPAAGYVQRWALCSNRPANV